MINQVQNETKNSIIYLYLRFIDVKVVKDKLSIIQVPYNT